MSLGKMIPLIGVIAIVMIFTSYTYGVLSENDEQINVEGTDYEESYNSNVAIQSGSSQLLTPIALILMLSCLIMTVGYLRKSRY